MTAALPALPRLAVSAAIFRDGQLLLVRRARQPALGLFTLPGGRLEFGETVEQAVHREIAEETALTIDVVGLAGWLDVLPAATGGQSQFVILPFAARWVAGEVTLNDELAESRWLDPDGMGELPLTKGLIPIVAAARRLIG